MSLPRQSLPRPEVLLRRAGHGASLFRRGVIFYSTAARMAAGYVRAQRAAKRLSPEAADRVWHNEHRKQALLLAHTAMRLRGMLIKTGQYMSARPDVLP